jgi:hypothetical protein
MFFKSGDFLSEGGVFQLDELYIFLIIVGGDGAICAFPF